MRSPFIDDAIENDLDIKNFEVECKCSAEVIWFRLPKEWTEAEANQQITDAKTWFRKYCIELTFKKFALDPPLRKPGEKEKKFAERMREFEKQKKELEDLLKDYENQVALIPKGKGAPERIYVAAHEKVMGVYDIIAATQPKKLVVLFLDEWWVPLHPKGAEVRASANHQNQPLIGLNRYDRASPLMLTHELAHGLRRVVDPQKEGVKVLDTIFERVGEEPKKLVLGRNTKCVGKFIKTNQVKDKNLTPRPWHDHYPPGKSDGRALLFIDRTDFRQPYPYTQARVFSVLEYLTILAAGYVSCTEGCDVKQETLTPFYLSDVLFELGGVAHSTQELRYPLLRGTLLPAEFTAVVQEEMPDVEIMSLPTLEESPSPFGINETSLEQPQVSAPPIEMLVPVGSVSWPEMPIANRDVNAFYLPDLTLDMTGVAHMTPGLRETAFSKLSLLAFNLPAFQQMGQTLLLRMNGADGETKVNPDQKIMAFGEFEIDATFELAKEVVIDSIFKVVEKNTTLITKDNVKSIVDPIPAILLTMHFTCTGSCETFDLIQIEEREKERKLYAPDTLQIQVPGVNSSLSLTIKVDVITAQAKINSPCITEEELDYRRKAKEALKAMQEFQEAVDKKAKGEKVELPPRPEAPEPPKERSKPGRQVQQDFFIRWDAAVSIETPVLKIINLPLRFSLQQITRYSPCCPIVPGAVPIPPGVPEGEGEKEDGKFFFAGFENAGETVSDYFPPSPVPVPPDAIAEVSGRKEAGIEEREKPVFVAGLEEIAISAEALATRFMSPDIAAILSQPTENADTELSSNEDLFTTFGAKHTPKR